MNIMATTNQYIQYIQLGIAKINIARTIASIIIKRPLVFSFNFFTPCLKLFIIFFWS